MAMNMSGGNILNSKFLLSANELFRENKSGNKLYYNAMEPTSIGPLAGVIIMMNNYFHDVATAMLVASAFVLWAALKIYDHSPNEPRVTDYFLKVYKGMTNVAKISLFWILIGGIPRTLFFRNFEWANAMEHSQIHALIIKHILAFSLVAGGVYLWLSLNGRINSISKSKKEQGGKEMCGAVALNVSRGAHDEANEVNF